MKKHAKQVAAWDKVLGHCNDKGESYRPSNSSINGTALRILLEHSQKSIQAVHNAQNDLVTAVNLRHRAFDQLPIIGTRIIGALNAIGAKEDHIADVNRIRLRFRFQPSKGSVQKKGFGGQKGQTIEGIAVPSTAVPRKNSQLDFESKIQNLTELIGLLSHDAPYKPNETELTIEGLNLAVADLREKNSAIENAKYALFKARKVRNELLFGSNGIYGHAKMVKEYFKSAFGTQSVDYKAIRKINFSSR